MNSPTEHNPYAPPSAELASVEQFQEGFVTRQEELLYIRNGAALPNRCFVTGEVTAHSYPLRQVWHPRWVYLLLPLVIPYFVASLLIRRRVELKVPISPRLNAFHNRRTAYGAIAMAVGGILAIGIIELAPAGLVICAIGFLFASCRPVRLRIVEVAGDVLIVQGVHPNCLAAVASSPHDEPPDVATPPQSQAML